MSLKVIEVTKGAISSSSIILITTLNSEEFSYESAASISILYVLFWSLSKGFSKSGVVLKLSSPSWFIVNKLASTPTILHTVSSSDVNVAMFKLLIFSDTWYTSNPEIIGAVVSSTITVLVAVPVFPEVSVAL